MRPITSPLRVTDPCVGLDEVVREALRAAHTHAAVGPLRPESSHERRQHLDASCHTMGLVLEAALLSRRGDVGLVVHALLQEAGLDPATMPEALGDLFERTAL